MRQAAWSWSNFTNLIIKKKTLINKNFNEVIVHLIHDWSQSLSFLELNNTMTKLSSLSLSLSLSFKKREMQWLLNKNREKKKEKTESQAEKMPV